MIDRTIHSRLRDARQEEVDRLLGEIATEFFERISQGESPKIDQYRAWSPRSSRNCGRMCVPSSMKCYLGNKGMLRSSV